MANITDAEFEMKAMNAVRSRYQQLSLDQLHVARLSWAADGSVNAEVIVDPPDGRRFEVGIKMEGAAGVAVVSMMRIDPPQSM
ncbi:hypothetical protein [Nakamurella aerolata]|uniref:Uncharacterized protein n=1 Tax=Nakamurella aerolata TaxID=1656892 RepID=A0A849A745_9ACTN|nr:hypothetical protein [Nakamurella aerolata]NNG34928.1 hypothetical protein [Nakamurella aerolata]